MEKTTKCFLFSSEIGKYSTLLFHHLPKNERYRGFDVFDVFKSILTVVY